MSRDDQFAGFAKKLYTEFMNLGARNPYSVGVQRILSREEVEQIIARRAYDLVGHTFYNTGPMMLDCYSHEEQVAAIPDMTAWPEETSDDR